MNVLVVDIGGNNVKILATGHDGRRKFPSGPKLKPQEMVAEVKRIASDWKYEVVSIGYPGLVQKNRPVAEPNNLGRGWVGFDFKSAFGYPVKVINDAAMQALGSYKAGLMLFIGLGTGIGSALVNEATVVPLELGHLPYKKGTYEDYIGRRALNRLGKKKWAHHVAFVVNRLISTIHPDDVVLGGGNVKELKKMPPDCRAGANTNAFIGGFRLWDEPAAQQRNKRSSFKVVK
jgi:polyphosphate glucokinase